MVGAQTTARPQTDRTTVLAMSRARFPRVLSIHAPTEGVQQDAGQAAYGENSADRRLAPMRIGEEVDVHVSAKAAPHVREEEIDPVKSNEPHEGDRLTKGARTAISADEQLRENVARAHWIIGLELPGRGEIWGNLLVHRALI
jgi:hypothetical protein